jgi:hypothetical protein
MELGFLIFQSSQASPWFYRAVANGPIDFYKIAGQSTFLAWPIETVEALFNNNDIRINVKTTTASRFYT